MSDQSDQSDRPDRPDRSDKSEQAEQAEQIERLDDDLLAAGERPLFIPSELPVLPLRDTVLFPNSFMPLAVAREASVRLIDEATTSGRMIAVFTQREASVEEPVQQDLYPIGTATHIHKMFKLPDGSLRLIVQGLARVRLDRIVQTRPYLRGAVTAADESLRDEDLLEIDALQRNIKSNFQQVVSLSPLLSDDLQALSANITDPGKLADFIASSLTTIGTPVKQEVLDTLDIRARMDSLNRILIKELEVLELGSKIQSQVQSEVGKNQREYFLREQLKAIQKELGEGDEQAKEIDELRVEGRRRRHAGGRQEGSAARARSAVEDAGGRRRVHGVADLHGLDRRAALGQAHRGLPRPAAHETGARRRPLRAREGEGPRARVPRGAQAESRREGADSLLPGPAGSGQDLARQVDRELAGAQVRARLARRHARRGGDSRAPADLHRRAARTGHPGPAPGRIEEPRLHPRRDRQARLRFPRRPGVGAARGPRSGAEQHVPRSLSRRAVRPVRGAVPDDRERARPDSAAAARPHGSARARRLHRGGEAEDCLRAPHRQAGDEPRADAGADRVHRRWRSTR